MCKRQRHRSEPETKVDVETEVKGGEGEGGVKGRGGEGKESAFLVCPFFSFFLFFMNGEKSEEKAKERCV